MWGDMSLWNVPLDRERVCLPLYKVADTPYISKGYNANSDGTFSDSLVVKVPRLTVLVLHKTSYIHISYIRHQDNEGI